MHTLLRISYHSYSTFKVYDAAISWWHALIDSKCDFTCWYPSYWRELWSCLPPRAPGAPSWDLPPVLYTVCLFPFESLGWLLVRAVFLLVIGSANSTGLLHAPSPSPVEVTRWPNADFLWGASLFFFFSNSFRTEQSGQVKALPWKPVCK